MPVNLPLDQVDDAMVAEQLLVVLKGEAFQSRIAVEHLHVWMDQGGRELSAIPDDDHLRNEPARHQHALHSLGSDILSAAGLDQVFLTVGNGQVSVAIDLSDVAGSEPAVLGECLAIEFWAVIVAPRNGIAANQDFAVGRNLDFDSADNPADGSDSIMMLSIGRYRRRGFGQAIAL